MTKLRLLMAASLLALAPQMAQASSNSNAMPGLESDENKGTSGSVPAKAQVQEEDDLDRALAKERERAQKLKELEDLRAKNEQQAKKLAQDESERNEKPKKPVEEKIGKETDRVFGQAAKQAERFAKHLRKKKF